MKNRSYIRFYRVYKHDTAVTEIRSNEFIPCTPAKFKRGLPVEQPTDETTGTHQFYYELPPDEQMFYGYLDKALAMEKAKAGALAYIGQMISEVERGIKKLTQYREDHYEDLNINLLDAQIRKFRNSMNMK
ncbi:hypothetical protein [Mucilaginibacter auburnensis]|uniref:Uncharacterized protein n=1 Tax=Mucilaginibacter auburnensis TaxID=1457233 RepID=A0A2H9VW12_9SPHI|nr:hypothetical protein [Mucilaginibacter auburnensis]PJJ85001.1 hypothetical protein CLV57_2024 [Mucilaginibacter auburnensis]